MIFFLSNLDFDDKCCKASCPCARTPKGETKVETAKDYQLFASTFKKGGKFKSSKLDTDRKLDAEQRAEIEKLIGKFVKKLEKVSN